MAQALRVVVSCCEPSGDRLAAELLAAIAELPVLMDVRGCVGPALRREGVAEVVPMETLAVMGLAEVLPRLPDVWAARRAMAATLQTDVDIAIFVDGPSFHLPLAQRAREDGVLTVGLVAPQVWAWKPERVADVARAYDLLLCLFDFEPPLFAAAMRAHGGNAVHMGHPVVDRLSGVPRSPKAPRFALLPGSRDQERKRHVPLFRAVANVVRERLPGAKFAWVGEGLVAENDDEDVVSSVVEIADCQAALTKSGTVTLELACLGVPMVVAHDVPWLTYAAGRLLVRHVDHIALPNILARREVVPEVVARRDPRALADLLLSLPQQQKVPLHALGAPGAAMRGAERILAALASRV